MIYLFIAFVMVFLVHQIFDIKNLYNPFVMFFLYHTFFLFIALSYKDAYDQSIIIYDPTVRLIVSSYLTSFLGALLSFILFKSMGFKYYRINDLKFDNSLSSYGNLTTYVILFLGFFMAIYFIIDTGGLIFFKADMENARINDRKGYGLITLMTLIFITFGFLLSLFTKAKIQIKLLLLLLSCFFLISFGNRAPMLELMVMSFVLFQTFRNTPIKFKYLALGGLSVFSLMVLLGVIRSGLNYSIAELFITQYGWRPFVNIQNLQWILDFFPAQMNHLNGGTMLIELKLFLPGSNPNFGQWLKEAMNMDFAGGSITTTHIGLAYINFGYVGAFLYPFLLGFLFQSTYYLILRKPKNSSLKLVFTLVLSFYLSGTVSSGLISVLIMNVLFLCFVAFCYISIDYFLREILKKESDVQFQ